MTPFDLSNSEVRIKAPARLHLGFLDLNGGLGRRFGSFGITLEGLATVVRARPAPVLDISGDSAERAGRLIRPAAERLGLPCTAALHIEQAMPEHAGLGSGTQLGLAVGMALARLHGHALTARQIGAALGRGARSGIGIGAFESGGVLLDGGRSTATGGPEPAGAPPPVIARLPFPEDWRLLLIFDSRRRGLHGPAETAAFRALPAFPADRAAYLCRLMVMVALPALAEADLPRFGAAIGGLQRLTGDHFAETQGGRFTSPAVAEVLAWLESRGIAGVGQSSWGPTGFAIVAAAGAERLRSEAEQRWAHDRDLSFRICAGRNEGAVVEMPAS